MTKFKQSNKESKRHSALTPKEKKAAKQMKQAKNQNDTISRLILRGSGGTPSKIRQF